MIHVRKEGFYFPMKNKLNVLEKLNKVKCFLYKISG